MYLDIKGFIWCNVRDVFISRIDYVFISNNFVLRIENIILRKILGMYLGKRMSDYRFLKFMFKILNNNRGLGYWKLNVLYCENEEYKSNIRNIVWILDNLLGVIDRWEFLKWKVKDFFIYFVKNKCKFICDNIKLIERKIDVLEMGLIEKFNYVELKLFEVRLNLFYDEKIKGI